MARWVTMRSTEVVASMSWERDVGARFERSASPRLHGATGNVLDLVAGLESAPTISRLLQLVRASCYRWRIQRMSAMLNKYAPAPKGPP